MPERGGVDATRPGRKPLLATTLLLCVVAALAGAVFVLVPSACDAVQHVQHEHEHSDSEDHHNDDSHQGSDDHHDDDSHQGSDDHHHDDSHQGSDDHHDEGSDDHNDDDDRQGSDDHHDSEVPLKGQPPEDHYAEEHPGGLSHSDPVQIAMAHLAAPFWGILADRNTMQRKSILMFCSMGLGIVSILNVFLSNWHLTMLLLATGESLASALWPIAGSIVAYVAPEDRRGRVFGFLRAAFSLGMLACTSGIMEMGSVEVFGLPGLRVALLCLGFVATVVSLLICAFLQEPPQQQTESLKDFVEETADMVKLFQIPTFSIILVASIFYSISWRSMQGYVMQFVDTSGMAHDLTFELNAALFLPHAIGSVVSGYATDALSARFGRRRIRPLTAQVTVGLTATMAILILFGVPPGHGALAAHMSLWAGFGFFSAWAEPGTDFPVLSEIMPGGLCRALAIKFCLQSTISSLGHLVFDHMFVHSSGTESASGVRTAIAVTATSGWLLCLAAYSFLHWSYPRDVRLRQARAMASDEAYEAFEGSTAGRQTTESDLPPSPSDLAEQTVEVNRSTSSSRLSSDSSLARYKGWGMDGMMLHSTVDPENWCVTKQDLIFFLDAVKEEVRAGRIYQHERDRFDPTDDQVGPSMYTVVDQYLRPLTARAGAMSWALMCHPRGLKCDLFITHGWAEGVYELLDNVVHSWPHGKHHAYICIFSNPQNLNISSMIERPSASPFARALDSSPCMMVVPNSKCSIYTRAWCVYEAWLAYKANKLIFTANRKPPLTRRLLECSLLFLLPVVVGAFGYYLLEVMSSVESRPVADAIRLSLCGLLLAEIALSSFCQTATVRSAAAKLRKRFTAVAETEATDPLDKQRILQDIGSDTGAVDESIQVLLRNGMSTPRLRNLLGRGVAVNSALASNSFPGIGLLFFFTLAGPVVLPWALAISIVWYRDDMDQRALGRGVVNNAARLVALVLVVVSISMWACDSAGPSGGQDFLERLHLVKVLVTNLFLCIVLGIVVAGLDRMSSCPVIGLPLAKMLRPGAFSACCCVSRHR